LLESVWVVGSVSLAVEDDAASTCWSWQIHVILNQDGAV
jgi:hypothetical protein